MLGATRDSRLERQISAVPTVCRVVGRYTLHASFRDLATKIPFPFEGGIEMLRKTGLLSVLLIVGLCAGAWAELISYHPFDEGSGTTSADATGNGHDGALEGGVEWVSGVKGTAVRLDTAGERVVIGEIDPTAAHNAMT